MEDISMRGAVVRISQDSMEAYLTLQPPEAGEGYTLSELVRYIRTQRVTNGIDEAAIQEMIDGGVYMRDVCIAKGQPPVNAETAAMNFISIRMWMENQRSRRMVP